MPPIRAVGTPEAPSGKHACLGSRSVPALRTRIVALRSLAESRHPAGRGRDAQTARGHRGGKPSADLLLPCLAGEPMSTFKLDPYVLRRLARDLALLADELGAEAAPIVPDHELDVRNWYIQRVGWLVATGQRASREDDERAFAASGFQVTREHIRALRREYAPAEWSRPGRPRREKSLRQICRI